MNICYTAPYYNAAFMYRSSCDLPIKDSDLWPDSGRIVAELSITRWRHQDCKQRRHLQKLHGQKNFYFKAQWSFFSKDSVTYCIHCIHVIFDYESTCMVNGARGSRGRHLCGAASRGDPVISSLSNVYNTQSKIFFCRLLLQPCGISERPPLDAYMPNVLWGLNFARHH